MRSIREKMSRSLKRLCEREARTKVGKACLAMAMVLVMTMMFVLAPGTVSASDMTEAIQPVFDIFPLLIELAVLSAVFGMIGALLVGLKFGRK